MSANDKQMIKEVIVLYMITFLSETCLAHMMIGYIYISQLHLSLNGFTLYFIEIATTAIVSYLMIINEKYSLLDKIPIVVFPVMIQAEILLLYKYFYVGLLLFFIVLIALYIYLMNCAFHSIMDIIMHIMTITSTCFSFILLINAVLYIFAS